MPGYSGLIDTTRALADPVATQARFERIQALPGVEFIHRFFRSDHCVVVNTLTGLLPQSLTQPVIAAEGDEVLFLDGEIYNLDELANRLGSPASPDSDPCRVLLALYRKHGIDFAGLLNGEFAVVIYHQLSKRLLIVTDHLSTRPVYYAVQGGALRFGSEKKAVLVEFEGKPSLDHIGLLQVFVHQHNLGARTFIKEVSSLPPSTVLEYKDGKVGVSAYRQRRFWQDRPTLRESEFIEAWSERMRQSTAARLRGKRRIVFSLSGGLDSRAIAASIPRDFRPVSAWTRGEASSLEVKRASEVAASLGLDYSFDPPSATPLSEILNKIVWRTEGLMSAMHLQSIANHTPLKSRGDFLMGGHLGDMCSGKHIKPQMLLPRTRGQFVDAVFAGYSVENQASLGRLFNESFLAATFPAVKEDFAASFARIEGLSNIKTYEAWDLLEHESHMTCGSILVDNHRFGHIHPYKDMDYLNFVMPLPTRLRFMQAMYQAVIVKLGPEFRHVRNANNNMILSDSLWGNRFNIGIEQAQKVPTRIMRKLKPGYRTWIERAEPQDRAAAIRQDAGVRRFIEAYVNSASCDAAVFNKPGIMSVLDEHYRGASGNAHVLYMLATYVAAINYFVDRIHPECPSDTGSWV